jgi:hypothetical protein
VKDPKTKYVTMVIGRVKIPNTFEKIPCMQMIVRTMIATKKANWRLIHEEKMVL